uniref:Uncharacterized protein n=1 Tax=Lactuca sativa TaxID=4236 RepID=A0A9R1WA05_LACSA|nr:hypothetical protein LSAT_V11C200061550 [Lactuca sativa]
MSRKDQLMRSTPTNPYRFWERFQPSSQVIPLPAFPTDYAFIKWYGICLRGFFRYWFARVFSLSSGVVSLIASIGFLTYEGKFVEEMAPVFSRNAWHCGWHFTEYVYRRLIYRLLFSSVFTSLRCCPAPSSTALSTNLRRNHRQHCRPISGAIIDSIVDQSRIDNLSVGRYISGLNRRPILSPAPSSTDSPSHPSPPTATGMLPPHLLSLASPHLLVCVDLYR